MLKKLFKFIVFSVLLASCGSSKKIVNKPQRNNVKNPNKTASSQANNNSPTLADKVIWTAVSYKGTPYRYGGTTKKGMDCSGLVYTAFKTRGVTIPRVSLAMSKKGYKVNIYEVKRGDLVFFSTSKSRKRINHVGLVTSVKNGTVYFIHSSTSKGVIVSSLQQNYWNNAFQFAKRIL